MSEVSEEIIFEVEQDCAVSSERETVPTQDVLEFSGIGPIVGVGRLGTLQRMMGIEAAQPIYNQLNASEHRHAEAARRVLGRTTLRQR